MTALLVLATFLFFAGLDYLLHRRKAAAHGGVAAAVAVPEAETAPAAPAPEPVFVAGYQLPDDRQYHPCHTWVRFTGPDTAVVGIDDFAAKLTGRAKGVRLPHAGDWVRPGEKAARVEVEGRSTEFVSPVDGEVVEVNPDLKKEPALATWDPYGRGWLFKVHSAGLAASARNLLKGRLARAWTEDSSQQLNLRLMALSGSVLQDGGTPAPDFARHLDAAEWKRLTDQFFLG
jgi:glycine cleavage system H lipoate-binding protein